MNFRRESLNRICQKFIEELYSDDKMLDKICRKEKELYEKSHN